MVFSDPTFIFFFLPITISLCLALRRTRLFNASIAIFSLIFFYWESGYLTLILLFSIALNYAGGIVLNNVKRKYLLALFIVANISILAYFKYTAFMLGIFDNFGNPNIATYAAGIILPIGISFYTFQGVSYIIDVWRGTVSPERNLITFAAYKTFFPQLIAGPIVRYVDVKGDFHHALPSVSLFAAGAGRFLVGLTKKVIIADNVALVADAAFSVPNDQMTFATTWLGAIAYSIQIYYDFSGYSDMAIGLAMMFGIRFRENFDHPYAASTITEFWRRWHISLSSWFRDYLYIPLGGNRHGLLRTYLNLSIVFLATGIWHGAAWTFLLWGVWHGTFLIIERVVLGGGVRQSLPMRIFYFFPVVILGWVLFRAADLPQFVSYSANMLAPLSAGAFAVAPGVIAAASPLSLLMIAIGAVAIVLQGQYKPIGVWISALDAPRYQPVLRTALTLVGIALAVFVIPQDFSPFLYFRF